MRNMSAWAIRNPLVPVVAFVVLTFMGIVAFIRLPINLDPDITFPLVSVVVSQPGAAPTEIETQITQKIEGAVAGVGNVRRLSSRAIEGQSLTSIEFQIGTPIDRAVSDVRDAVSKVRSELPDGVEEPLVQRINFSGGAIAYYAVASTAMTPEQLSWFVGPSASRPSRSTSRSARPISIRPAAARRSRAASRPSACSAARAARRSSARCASGCLAVASCGCRTSPMFRMASPRCVR